MTVSMMSTSLIAGNVGTPVFAQVDGSVERALGSLGTTPIWILAGYLIVLLMLGFLGWRKSRQSEEDYYLASRGQGWVISSVTIMATFFSSFALLGAPGMVYREGVLFALFSLNVPVAGLCVYLFGSRIWKVGRQFGYVTAGDMVTDYYGGSRALRILVAVASFLYVLPYVVMQIQAGGILSAKMFPGTNSFAVGAIVLAAVTMIYIMIGGMRSVAWTDLIQGTLLILGMLVSGFAMFLVFGGPTEFGHRVGTELPEVALTVPGTSGKWPWTMLFSVCVLASSGSMVQPAQWMRFYSARDVRTLKRGAVIFAVVLTSCFILGVMLIGLAGHVLYPLSFALEQSVESEAASVVVPEDLQAHFSVGSTENPGESVLRWSWQGRQERAMADADKARLLELNPSASYRAGIEGLYRQTRDPETLAIPSANKHVVDYNSILVVVVSEVLPLNFGHFGIIAASLILVAIMAASMSTADSNLHALSAVATRVSVRRGHGARRQVFARV